MSTTTALLHIQALNSETTILLQRVLRERLFGYSLYEEKAVLSQRNWIEEELRLWSDDGQVDLILTIGGTYPAAGLSNDECVPEATLAIGDRMVPGISEFMRAFARQQTVLADLHRGVAVIRGRTLVVNLPEGTAASLLFLEGAIDLIAVVLRYLKSDSDRPKIEDHLEISDVEDELSGLSAEQNKLKAESRTKFNPSEFAEFLSRLQNK